MIEIVSQSFATLRRRFLSEEFEHVSTARILLEDVLFNFLTAKNMRQYRLERYEGNVNGNAEGWRNSGWKLAKEFDAANDVHAIDRARFFTYSLGLDFSKVRLTLNGREISGI